ncbi:MAG TPA: acVLRF1 family peptidyl-tRNA hydrolase [Nocardioides sp.]|uniref:acVLRF1 family peptidyl-tRNA hydrolase n=1 Tax=Nocardioides sp. TaxID=35761 RepID=UPI002D7F4ECB|nr:acVLRF1 family peptidyl-tRNA hydrolase [Nocardioides sp.]HET6653537.1 acVLRF1 family peptidyl-tRNA hydrolase [Nocardioides sp.]
MTRTVLVPPERLARWCENFAGRHGAVTPAVSSGRLVLSAADGASAEVALPFDRRYDGAPDPAEAATAAGAPLTWGVLLVRKGGFAVAVVDTDRVVASKVGQRHVQGRTKAGGQSQQRFARRRDNQARQAYEAAADHAFRILAEESENQGPHQRVAAEVTPRRPVSALVCGGDRSAVDAVLADPRLARSLAGLVVDPWLPVPDPRRAVLDQAVADGRSLRIHLTDP